MGQLEEELYTLKQQLQAYDHMRRIRELTIDMANKDIADIDNWSTLINNRIKEIEHVQGTVHTIQAIQQGSDPE